MDFALHKEEAGELKHRKAHSSIEQSTLDAADKAPLVDVTVPVEPPEVVPAWTAANHVTTKKDRVPLLILTILSGFTRLWRLGYPPVVVFDELFYTRFVHMYINRLFHFDSNPPFAKQLIALTGYLAGYGKQNETFEKIGDRYADDTPIWALRLVPALSGTLLIPLAYCITRELGYSRLAASLAASCFLFDSALVTGSRFVLTDSVNLCLLLGAVFAVLKFIKKRPLGPGSLQWGLLAGTCMGLAISTKYTAFNSLLVLAWIVTRHLWKTIDDVTISAGRLVKYWALCCLVVFLIPTGIYLSCFYAHLAWLTKAGPYDSMMSTRFQSSLEGGLETITQGQPFNIAYGSQITLRNVAGSGGNPCWLHSHEHNYPIKYDDGRGSSHQQHVTCYGWKDINNWWIVKYADRPTLNVEQPPVYVKDGDIVQLLHGMTFKNLNSHDVAAPVTAECQEVSCFVDHNISATAQDLWEVKVVGQEGDDPVWHTIQSQVHFIHVATKAALSATGKSLPDWGFHQGETVSCEAHKEFTSSLWTVEEHRYTKAIPKLKDEREYDLRISEFTPDKPAVYTLSQKFLELQGTMLGLTKDTVEEHFYGSGPQDWILSDNGVAYWAEKGSNKQIFQAGNVLIWQTGAAVITLTVLILLVIWLVDLRYPEMLPVPVDQWNRILYTTELVLSGWVINWLPYFFTDRTLFFHHYYPGLAFKFILIGCFVGEVLDRLRGKYGEIKVIVTNVATAVLGVWLLSVIYNFYIFIPLTYGFYELSVPELKNLEWRETWNFIIRSQ
ncbi:Protein O-mannosyltransferase 1 [Hypsibius exemplaris]|uniref:Protein O-mannosyltransferase 1 n=1 Tax=Hypsibius exemplaris TaxID=2072580 RepID=A0A1W0WXC2_HYPEX|nr:Protein O-mannosyltransferase 1 [Hypsibius exemplaris]